MTAANLDHDVVTMTDSVLEQLVIDLNKGTAGGYRIAQTRTYSVRSTPAVGNGNSGWVVNTDDRFVVTLTDKGKTRDIATLYIRDGALRSVIVERDVPFHLVPRVLRAVTA